MSSGRNTLAAIERALSESRGKFRSLDIELQSASASLARNRRREVAIYQQLARSRLAELSSNTVVEDADEADRKAAQLLAERETELDELTVRIEQSERALTDKEADRDDRAQTLADAESALDALLADVDAQLQDDNEYRALLDEAQRALDTAANAQLKTTEAQATREEKRKPFEADPLFSYLWSRQYGTREYRAGLLTRFMDGLVARHIRYEPARRNYHMLNEIPKRLATHTRRLERTAETTAERVSEYETRADDDAGAAALRQAVVDAEASMRAADANIDTEQARFTDLVTQREQFAIARDPKFLEAMKVLQAQFRAEPIPQLQREAAFTDSVADDALVDELADLRDQQQRLSQYLDDHRDMHSKRADRVNELAAIRRRYKERGYDAGNSIIDEMGKIDMMLGEFLQGLVSSERLWSSIRHAQRFRRSRIAQRNRGPRMGGVRLGKMPRGIRVPRSGGFSGRGSGGSSGRGGGFRTKGGF
ncbi:MAG: hypothetical protein AAF270_02925 [Pseudomonadota bacterium]